MLRVFNICLSALAPGVMLAMSGCAAFPSASQLFPASVRGQVPLVQNCAVLVTGTPSRFACNDKVYTSFELARLRESDAKRYLPEK
jgi:hypothetical protein